MKLPLLLIIIFVSFQTVHTQWGDTLTNNPVFRGPFTQFGPRGVTDGARGAIIVWVDAENAYVTGIYAQRVEGPTGNRMFDSSGVEIFKGTLTGGERFADAVSDGEGGAIVIWGTLNTSVGFVYAQRINGSGTLLWSQAVPLTNGPRISSRARIVSDGFGGAIIVWAERDSALVSWIYTQRLNKTGETQWGVNGLRVCNNAIGHQFNPMITEDGLGGVIVVWEDLRSLTYQDLYAQRINFSGIPQWSPDGKVVFANQLFAMLRGAVSDGAAGIIVCWWDLTQGDYSVSLQHLNAQGVQLWQSSGITLAGPGKIADPLIAGDGSGGGIISWIDSTQGYNQADIFAQRIGSSGLPLWNSPVHIAEVGWYFGFYSLMAVENSGSIISWSILPDPSNPNEIDLYSQKLNGFGDREWQLNGAPISKAPGIQINAALVPDEAGGAIAIWQDTRNPANFADIYAQNLVALGLPTRISSNITQTNHNYSFVAGSTPLLTANFSALGSVSQMTVDAYVNGLPPGLTKAIPRYFGLSVDGSGFNSALTFIYTDEEVAAAGLTNGDAKLKLYKNEGTGWELVGGMVDPISNTIAVSDVTSFSLWAIRDPTDTVTVSVHEEMLLPKEFVLYQNYPNPFNPSTSIRYAVSNRQFVSLKIYDVLGNEIATLVNEEKSAGNYEVSFDASALTSGIYFYQLKVGNAFTETKKLVLMK